MSLPAQWKATAALAVGTAVATTFVLDYFIRPWIERHVGRRKAARASRDALSENMFVIIAAGARLAESDIPQGLRPSLRQALHGERARWNQQLDDATRFLIDNMHTYLRTYHGAGGIRDLLVQYVVVARGIVISERSQARKARQLSAMTEEAWGLFFGLRAWDPRAPLRASRHVESLRRLLDEANSESEPTSLDQARS